ncbi:hypothetical protein [Litoreibacter albidus]|uniref:hypothetical protein n=1 Tax=Litoreibacter albidus TaxID=670155 RepID=UPI0037356953
MVGDSKILTVSYGTFSCTLEGFDEPFSTMKAIAEYFRDLAADDRYFGAEPPTPDTEMLHKIAESTIKRRVAAELAENGVILRQTEATPQVAAEAPALAVEMPNADVPEQQSQEPKADVMSSVADVPAEPQPTPVRASAIPTITSSEGRGGDTVAEKLQRIRAVVARENAAPVAFDEDQHADEFGQTAYDAEEIAPSALFDTPIDTGFEDEDGGTLDAVMAGLNDPDEIEEEAAVAPPAAEDPVVEEPVEDTVADEVEAEAETAPEEDLVAEDAPVEATEEDAPFAVETEAEDATAEPEAQDTAPEAPVAEETATDEDGDEEAAAEETVGDATSDVEEDSEVAASGEDVSPLRTKPRRRIVVQKISRADMEAAQAAREAQLPPEMEAELMAELAEVEAETTPVAEAEIEDTLEMSSVNDTEAEAEAEAEAEDVATAEEEPAQDDDSDDILSRLSSSLDAPVEEATPETAEVPANDADDSDDILKSLMDDTAAAQADETEAAAQVERAEERKRKSLAATAEDDAIERLMTTTGSRLDNDESSVRRASIAHLKAAVAATKADSTIAAAADKREEEELDQYRDDLARVVRPGRPVAGSSRSDRPSPLVLISEQRIDHTETPKEAVAATAGSVDVRPRRVTRGNLALQEEMEEEFETEDNLFNEDDQVTFAEYAAKNGALELPDLLEAAAAHYIDIEGAEHFTRPMLMRKLAQISGPDAPSREDGLRAFGTLLRTGKIVKTDNGKFTLSKSSQFA